MRTQLILGLILLCSAAGTTSLAGAQASTDKPAVLISCVRVEDVIGDRFTLPEWKGSPSERRRWTTLKRYLGQSISVVGGLRPTANIAAQESNLDMTVIAMATTGRLSTANSKVRLPALSVTHVRPVISPCAP
jgi:hypothetical protein